LAVAVRDQLVLVTHQVEQAAHFYRPAFFGEKEGEQDQFVEVVPLDAVVLVGLEAEKFDRFDHLLDVAAAVGAEVKHVSHGPFVNNFGDDFVTFAQDDNLFVALLLEHLDYALQRLPDLNHGLPEFVLDVIEPLKHAH